MTVSIAGLLKVHAIHHFSIMKPWEAVEVVPVTKETLP
jgi:hypothetical protein